MFNIQTPELLVILVVALLVLGPTKLPEAMRKVGGAVGELRRMSSGFQAELRDALHEPVDQTPRRTRPTPDDGSDGNGKGNEGGANGSTPA